MNAWIQSRKKFSATMMSAVMAGALVVPSANAVTPDTHIGLSGIWTTAKLLKEYIDWRASTGWGAIGATNVLITKITGGSDGEMTKAVFTAMCGTTAAGLVANWKPASEPTTASHIKAIIKSATVVSAGSACGWASKFAFDKINGEIPKAQNFLNNTATPSQKSAVANAAAGANTQLLAMEAALRSLSNAKNDNDQNQAEFNRNCGGNNGSSYCNDIRTNLRNSQKNFDDALASFNRHGSSLRANMTALDANLRS